MKMDWLFEYMLPSAINAILLAIKNPDAKAKYRSAFLKIYRAIGNAFIGDIAFHPDLALAEIKPDQEQPVA